MKSFLSGVSWISFKIVDMQLSEATPNVLKNNLKVFDEHFLIEFEFWAYYEMICLQIILEERPNRRRSKTKKRPTDDTKKKKKQILQIAISLDDSIFFSNHHLTQLHQELFTDFFEASDITPYELFGSPPYDLLNLYQQSKQYKNNLKLKLESFDGIIEEMLSMDKKPVSKIFVEENNFPHIRKLHVNEEIKNVEDNEEFEEVLDIQIEEIGLVIQGNSTFMHYAYLEDEKKRPQMPQWLTDCKSNGRTLLKYRSAD